VYARGPIEQAAIRGERRPVGDSAALAAPRDVPAAGASGGADQHPAGQQTMTVRAVLRWPDHPLTRCRSDQLADSGHTTTLGRWIPPCQRATLHLVCVVAVLAQPGKHLLFIYSTQGLVN
jgi:hypothetical protein